MLIVSQIVQMTPLCKKCRRKYQLYRQKKQFYKRAKSYKDEKEKTQIHKEQPQLSELQLRRLPYRTRESRSASLRRKQNQES